MNLLPGIAKFIDGNCRLIEGVKEVFFKNLWLRAKTSMNIWLQKNESQYWKNRIVYFLGVIKNEHYILREFFNLT